MQRFARPNSAVLSLGLLLLVAASVLDVAHACGEHGTTPAWQQTVEVHGRRRSLLSFKARRCVVAAGAGGMCFLGPMTRVRMHMSVMQL